MKKKNMLFPVLFFSVLLGVFFSCKKSNKLIVVDYSNTDVKYHENLDKAIAFQMLFNSETQVMTDFHTYFDTLTYKKDLYTVLTVKKDNYEVLVNPMPGSGIGSSLFIFTKDSIYNINREPMIIKNWPSEAKSSR